MLSYTIRLSVTIKEYKEVPLSLRGRTHSLKLRIIPSTGYFGKAPKIDEHRNDDQMLIARAMVFLRSNGSLEVRWQQKAMQPFIHEHLFHQKVDVTSGVREEGLKTSQGMLPATMSTATPAAILTLTMPCHAIPASLTGALDLKRPWRRLSPRQGHNIFPCGRRGP